MLAYTVRERLRGVRHVVVWCRVLRGQDLRVVSSDVTVVFCVSRVVTVVFCVSRVVTVVCCVGLLS